MAVFLEVSNLLYFLDNFLVIDRISFRVLSSSLPRYIASLNSVFSNNSFPLSIRVSSSIASLFDSVFYDGVLFADFIS